MELPELIESAFPDTPYPGDSILGDCWCEECEWAVRSLRGKSWRQITLDDLSDDGHRMGDAAFLYYLPAILRVSLANPDEVHLHADVYTRFIMSDRDPPERAARISELVAKLSPPQRSAVAHYLDWTDQGEFKCPIVIEPAKTALLEGRVEPFGSEQMLQWAREAEARLKAKP